MDASRREPTDVTLIISFDPMRTSPNRRLHWAVRAKETYCARVATLLAWQQAGSPTIAGRVRVEITIRRGRRMDPDNALACCKPILDQLLTARRTGCGVVQDDSERWVSYEPVRQETSARYAVRPEVVVAITPNPSDEG